MTSTPIVLVILAIAAQSNGCPPCKKELVLTRTEYSCLLSQIDVVIERSKRRGRYVLAKPLDKMLCTDRQTEKSLNRTKRLSPNISKGSPNYVTVATEDLRCLKENPVAVPEGKNTLKLDFTNICSQMPGNSDLSGRTND